MPSATYTPRTLYDKVFQAHIVDEKNDGTILLYIDRHLVHEVTSPVSFASSGRCCAKSGLTKIFLAPNPDRPPVSQQHRCTVH